MKTLVAFLFILIPFCLSGKENKYDMLFLQKDSLIHGGSREIEQNWRFYAGDDPAMADTGYDDSKWDIVNSKLYKDEDKPTATDSFNGIGWFRYHFLTDTGMQFFPLAFSITHYGASEIYLDGVLMKKYGVVSGPKNTNPHYPVYSPFIATIRYPGHHVLAVRYANYNAARNRKIYDNDLAGFTAKVSSAAHFVDFESQNFIFFTFVLILLFGIFIALGIAHLFLYLFDRSSRSNLFFSIFCSSFALLFFAPWLGIASSNPDIVQSHHFSIPVIITAICISLSGFVNTLFSKRLLRFRIIAICAALGPIVYWIHSGIGIMYYGILFVFVLPETIILIIGALYRKVEGARIIGIGVLLFSLFSFFTALYLVIFQSLVFDNESVWELVFLFITGSAILSLPISMSLYLAWSFASVNRKLTINLEQVKELSEKTIAQESEKNKIIESQNELLEKEVLIRTAEVISQKNEIEKQHNELKTEKEKSDTLLLNILPEEIADELKEKGFSAARSFNDVSVLFTDFVDFTKAGERMSPQELVDELHVCFKTFDEIISGYGIEKIKTIGDAYLAVGGLPVADPNHAVNAVKAAIDILDFMRRRKQEINDRTFEIRIGIHSGSVVAGIVGIKKFAYDIWGDTVNTAARMEQSSEPGKINISESTYLLVKNQFNCIFRGKIEAKNKGELNMYFVTNNLR